MKMPRFLKVTPLRLRLTAAAAAAAPGKVLPFVMQCQLRDYWCWAATSSSVSGYFNAASAWTQCKVANGTLNRTDCCSGVGAGPAHPSGNGKCDPSRENVPCNRTSFLEKALTTTGNLAAPRIDSPSKFSVVRDEVDHDRPLGCRVEWGTLGHFVVIYGWEIAVDGTEYVDVGDPIYGNNHIPIKSFRNWYLKRGRWTHSYLTKA